MNSIIRTLYMISPLYYYCSASSLYCCCHSVACVWALIILAKIYRPRLSHQHRRNGSLRASRWPRAPPRSHHRRRNCLWLLAIRPTKRKAAQYGGSCGGNLNSTLALLCTCILGAGKSPTSHRCHACPQGVG